VAMTKPKILVVVGSREWKGWSRMVARSITAGCCGDEMMMRGSSKENDFFCVGAMTDSRLFFSSFANLRSSTVFFHGCLPIVRFLLFFAHRACWKAGIDLLLRHFPLTDELQQPLLGSTTVLESEPEARKWR
jgi:hypothetical protein